MAKGGGGAAGVIEVPEFMETRWENLMGNTGYPFRSLISAIGNAIDDKENPFKLDLLYNPAAEVARMEDRYDEFDTLVGSFDPEGRYETAVAKAKSLIDEELDGSFEARDISSLVGEIVTSALTDVGTAFDQIFSKGKSEVSTLVEQGSLLSNTEANRIINRATDRVKEEITELLQIAFDDLETKMPTIMTSAVSAAAEALEGEPFRDAVDAFERGQRASHLRSINQFTAGMADINAVQGSAFLFGMANLEAERKREVAEFETTVKVETYRQVLPSYINSFVQSMFQYVSAQLQDAAQYVQVYGSNQEVHSRFFTQIMQAQSQIFLQRFGQHLQQSGSLVRQAQGQETQSLQRSIDNMSNLIGRKVAFEREATALRTEIGRIGLVAKGEYGDKKIDVGQKAVHHPLELRQYGFNALASLAGATVGFDKEPNKIQSAIGGALSGAAAGAEIAGGHPAGAGIGALIGAYTATLE